MESLGWDDQQVLTNTWNNSQHASTLWSHQESLITSNSNNSCLFSGKNNMDLTEDIFNQIQGLQKALTPQLNSNSDRRQETSRLVTNTILQKPGAGTCWIDASNQELFSSPLTDKPYGALTGFGMNDQSRIINGLPNGKSTGVSTGSLESLDCLLSATNSNTDTSVEDDGISVIFSDCRNLWNFGANSAASSGESENNTSIPRNKETMSRLDETVCQSTCSDRKCSQTAKPAASAKRSSDQTENKAGYFDLLQTDPSTTKGGFQLISENPSKPKRQRSENNKKPSSSNINFQQASNSSVSSSIEEPDPEAIAQMKEMIYKAAAFRPVNLGLEVVEKPKRKNVRISTDPQTVAARQRRERISERIRVLQRLVPGGSKMDTASMLDEAANYLKFLRSQVKALENLGHKIEVNSPPLTTTTNIAFSSLPFNNHSFHPMQQTHFSLLQNPNHIHHPQS